MIRNCLAAAAFVASILPAAASAQDGQSQDAPVQNGQLQDDPGQASPAREGRSRFATGFRVEALIGFEKTGFDSVFDSDGLLYGVGIGYDAAYKKLRFGVEAELSDSTSKTCGQAVGFGQFCLSASRDLYVGGRFGGEVSRGVLLYGKAGYTNFRESNRFPPSLGSIVTHPNADGFRLGAGTEVAVGRTMFVKAEYRFSNYERAQGFDKHQAVLGFGIRF